MTPEIRVAPGFGARELFIEWYIEPDPRFSVEITVDRVLDIFHAAIAAGCFGPGGAVALRTRRESIGNGELVRGTMRLPPVHAVAVKCLGRIAKCANKTLAFSAVEAGAAESPAGRTIPDALPVGDPPPHWATGVAKQGESPALFALATPPNVFSRKFTSVRVVVAEGEEQRAAAPVEHALRSWGDLLGVGAFPFEGGGSNGWVDRFHNLFADEFTATLEAVATDALGFQSLLLALRHIDATVCAVRAAEVTA